MRKSTLIDGKYEYFAFISYKEEDAEWAKWLQRKLEHYKLPSAIRKEKPELPERISPIYEYKSEAGGGRLKEVIWKGLTSSKYLIVICSPRAGGNKSQWLNNGIRHFIESGQEENIIPFIVEGKPKAKNPDEECFPGALLELKDDRELRGININEMGRDAAAIKVVSRMFDVKFDMLWQRYEREQRKQRRKKTGTIVGGISILTIASIIFAIIVSGKNSELEKANNEILQERDRADSLKNVALITNDSLQVAFANIKLQKDSILKQNQIISKQKNDLNNTNKDLQLSNVKLAQERDNVLKANWKMMVNQSKSAAGKANELIENGNPLMAERIMMNFLPDSASNIRWPYVPEVEQAYRKSLATINSAEWHQDTYFEHKLNINTAIFNSDGSKILSSSNDNTACLWDIETGDTISFLHDRLVNCAAISTDGKFVATGCRDEVARIWNAETGQLVDSWEPGGNVWEILFSRDNKYVLTRSSQGALSFYSVENHKILGRFPYRQRLSEYVFDDKRESFVYGCMDSLVTLVNIPILFNKFDTVEKIATNEDLEGFRNLLYQMRPNGITPIIYPHSYNAQDIKYNSQKETVCILCSDSVAVYGNMKTGTIIDTIPNVLDFSFSPDGTTLALSRNDRKVLLIKSYGETYDYDESSIETNAVFHQINYSENGSYLIGSSSDNVTYLWDVSDKYAEVAKLQHKSPINFSFVNNTGSNILTVTNDNHVNLWGHSVGYKKTSLALADSYADAVIFNKEESLFYVASYDGHISCYDVITGKQMWTRATYSKNYNNLRNGCIDLSAEGTKLAIGNESGEIIIVDATSGEILNRYRIHKEVINSIFFIDDNKVITSSHDGKVIISDIVDGKTVITCIHDNRVIFANIIKGHQQILSATANGLFLWQIGSNESSFFPLNNDEIESVAYNIFTNKVAIGTSNNSIYIKTIDEINNTGLVFQHGQSPQGELFLFDSFVTVKHDPELIKKIQGSMEGYHLGSSLYDILSHKGRVDALQFSIDGNYLVSKCKSSIKVWHTTTGVCINDEIRVGIGFRCFAISPQKTYIITSSMDVKNEIPNEKNKLIDYLFLWKFNSLNKSLWKEKERLPNWELTPEEKRKYYLE
jgi:WD40 repeat protein